MRHKLLGLLALGLANASCSGGEAASAAETQDAGALECIEDKDGDGFGVGCPKGDDCDDTDASIHFGCVVICKTPKEGCACEPDSPPVECTDRTLEDDHVTLCKTGMQYCRDGKWTSCETVAHFQLKTQ